MHSDALSDVDQHAACSPRAVLQRSSGNATLTTDPRALACQQVDLALNDPGTDIVTRQTLVTGWERVALCWEGKGFGPPWRPEFISAASIEWMLRDQASRPHTTTSLCFRLPWHLSTSSGCFVTRQDEC
jgi:hypothetical protein